MDSQKGSLCDMMIGLEQEHVNCAGTVYKTVSDMGGTCSESPG
jgi:hypothetical protein